MKLTFLGTGTSHGIPVIGCGCDVCTSSDQKDRRRRCSIHIKNETTSIVIDTPPDFREQVLSFGVERIDALFITHPHADHIFGFDDIRRFSSMQKEQIPVYGSEQTIKSMCRKFDYVCTGGYDFHNVPQVAFTAQKGPVDIGPFRITPLPVVHGKESTTGYLVEDGTSRIGYIPDCKSIPESTMKLLYNMDIMVLDGLRSFEHPTHLTFDESAALLKKIYADRSFFTHICHELHHEALQKAYPDITIPWDGLEILL